MSSRIKYGILLTIPMLLFIVGFYNVEELRFPYNSSGNDQIEYQGYFPDIDTPIASGTTILEVEAHPTENIVATISQRPSNVYLFEKDGNYIDQPGAKGNGPGEYVMPNAATLVNNEIVLYDSGNAKVIAFSINDYKEEVYSFIPDHIASQILTTDENVLLFPYYNQVGNREVYLYTLYKTSGDKVGEYGEIPDKLREMSSFPLLSVDLFDEDIYVLPFPSTTVYRFGMEEHLFESIELKGRNYPEIFDEIHEGGYDETRTKFMDVKVNEDGIFVSVIHFISVDHYDLDGNYIQTFDFRGEYEEKIREFSVNDNYIKSFDMVKLDDDRYRLYGVVSGDFPRVLMFDIEL